MKFKRHYKKNINYFHCKRPNPNRIRQANQVCLLLRDPVTRFVSVFFYCLDLYNHYITEKKTAHENQVLVLKEVFDKFKTPNELAEAISDEKLHDLAIIFFLEAAHMKCGFRFYLQNEEFIQLLKEKACFVIRQEHYEDDFQKYHDHMVEWLRIPNPNIDLFLETRRNNTDQFQDKKQLSKKAIRNLKIILEDEYLIFDYLIRYGLITQEYRDSFL